MALIATEISTDKFNYNERVFSQEMSSLTGLNLIGQIWDDACDEGFILVSEKTGKKLIFHRDREDIHDGEIQGWWFTCTEVADLSVLIIND